MDHLLARAETAAAAREGPRASERPDRSSASASRFVATGRCSRPAPACARRIRVGRETPAAADRASVRRFAPIPRLRAGAPCRGSPHDPVAPPRRHRCVRASRSRDNGCRSRSHDAGRACRRTRAAARARSRRRVCDAGGARCAGASPDSRPDRASGSRHRALPAPDRAERGPSTPCSMNESPRSQSKSSCRIAVLERRAEQRFRGDTQPARTLRAPAGGVQLGTVAINRASSSRTTFGAHCGVKCRSEPAWLMTSATSTSASGCPCVNSSTASC